MSALLVHLTLFAEAAAEAAPAHGQQPAPTIMSFLPMIAMLVLVTYFVLFRPERQKQAAQKRMIEGLKKSDHVITLGGIKGVVSNVYREVGEVSLTVDETNGTKIRVLISSITQVEGDESDDSKKK